MSEPPSQSPTTDKRLQALVDSAMGLRKKKPKPQKPLLSILAIMRRTQWTYWNHGSKGFCYNTTPLPGADLDRPGRSTPLELRMLQDYRWKPWVAWKVRINWRKHIWTPMGQPVFFARRKKAAEKAYQWYEKANPKQT